MSNQKVVRVRCNFAEGTSLYFSDGKVYNGTRNSVGRAVTVRDDRGCERVVIPDGTHCPHFTYVRPPLLGGYFVEEPEGYE